MGKISSNKKITIGVILITIIGWIGWDIFAVIEPTPGDSESEVLREWGYEAPAFVWAVGALCGHWWGSWRVFDKVRNKIPWSPIILGVLGVGFAGVNLAGVLPTIHPMLSFLVGIPFGAVLWAQGSKE